MPTIAQLQSITTWLVMATHACTAWMAVRLAQLATWGHFPIILMAIVQLAGAGMQVWTKEVIRDYDLRPFIFVFLRQIVSSILLSPATYLERNTRPPLTWWIFLQIVCCSVLGIVVNQAFFITGLKLTSATKASAIANLLPVVTWAMGFVVGQESFTFTRHGICKSIGTLVCVGGAIIISTVQGPAILSNSGLFGKWYQHGTHAKENYLGLVFVSISCVSAAGWFTILGNLRNSYDAPLTITCLTSCMSILPLGILAFSFEHDMAVWRAMGAMDYGLAIYSGAIGTALSIYLINLCITQRGSHFVSTFSPSSLVIVTVLSWIFTNTPIFLGSFIGSAVLLVGLALALFAMHRERVLALEAEERAQAGGDASA